MMQSSSEEGGVQVGGGGVGRRSRGRGMLTERIEGKAVR